MANPYIAAGSTASVIQTAHHAEAQHSLSDKAHTTTSARSGSNLHTRALFQFISTKDCMAFLAKQLVHYRMQLVLCVLLCCISVAASLYIPVSIGVLIDSIAPAHKTVSATQPQSELARLLACICCSSACMWISSRLCAHTCSQLVCALRRKLISPIDRVPMSDLSGGIQADFHSRLLVDCETFGDGLLQGSYQLMSGVITLVAGWVCMAHISLVMAVCMLVLMPSLVWANLTIMRRAQAHFSENQNLQGALSSFIDESIAARGLFRAFRLGASRMAIFTRKNADMYEAGMRAQFVSSLSNPTTRLINNLLYAAIVAIGGYFIITNAAPFGIAVNLSIGSLIAFLTYAQQMMKPAYELSATVSVMQAATASLRRLCALAQYEHAACEDSPETARLSDSRGDTPEKARLGDLRGNTPATDGAAAAGAAGAVAGATAVHPAPSSSACVQFDSVSFSYTPQVPVLSDISFEVKHGEHLAIVGHTGSGKTTLLSLLVRFIAPQKGSVYYKGQNITALSRKQLRQNIALVSQESALMHMSVADNMTYGCSGISRASLISAAKTLGAYTTIMQLPYGFDTIIDPLHTTLSAGQIQLICIARALLANPDLLLLDEATSNVDVRSEHIVQAAFDTLMRDRTSIVVAHRLSTIMNADTILMLDKGRIIEKGSHAQLMRARGAYYELFQAQFTKNA